MKNIRFFFLLTCIVGFVISGFTGSSEVATVTTVLAVAGVAWPAGGVTQLTPAFLATLPVTIDDQFTILAPAILTGAQTCNLTIAATVRPGAIIQTLIKATATEVWTAGTGFTGPTQIGVAGKTKSCLWVYDGVTFKMAGTPIQID